MGLKYPREKKHLLGSADAGVRVKMRRRRYVPLSQTFQILFKDETNRHILFATLLARGIENGAERL